MRLLARFLPLALALAWIVPTPSDACVISLGVRGTFMAAGSETSACLTFVDAMGTHYEIVGPSPVWKHGMKGLIFAEQAGRGSCTPYAALRVCSFQGDKARSVTGTLARRESGDCPGFVIAAAEGDLRILNCADFGPDLCSEKRLGRPVQVDAYVEGPAPSCPGQPRATVLSFEFPD